MGLILTKLQSYLTQRKIKIAIVGLDGSGKTTIVYQLKKLCKMEEEFYIPTSSSNQIHRFKNVDLVELDCLYQNILPLYQYNFRNTDGLIFVVDSNYANSFELLEECLRDFIVDFISKEIPLLIYINKTDLCDSITKIEISTILGLQNIPYLSKCNIQKSCAIEQDERLKEGFSWLLKQIHQIED